MRAGKKIVEIDGSRLEGGGQILRTSCALAAVTGLPCHIYNIRAGRKKPGLRAQHLAGVEAVAALTDGVLEGAQFGSTDLTFHPGTRRSEELLVEIPTAGSIPLVMQALMPPSVMGSSDLVVRFSGGATDTFFAPPLDYFMEVFLPTTGLNADINLKKLGYYPRGGAELTLSVKHAKPKQVSYTQRGRLASLTILSRASESLKGRDVAERLAHSAASVLAGLGVGPDLHVLYGSALSSGCSITIVARYEHTVLGASALGERGKRAEDVGRAAAEELLGELHSGACLDRHMADQVLPYMALSGQTCEATVSEITLHARTNMWVVELFLPGRFKTEGTLVRWEPINQL